VRPGHHRRDSCQLLRTFKLERPAFGGRTRTPLRVAYRLSRRADVTVTIRRGRRVVRRFTQRGRAAGRVYRLAVPSRNLPRGDYEVQLRAVGGEDQIAVALAARRI
jgi:hypothetical protein